MPWRFGLGQRGALVDHLLEDLLLDAELLQELLGMTLAPYAER